MGYEAGKQGILKTADLPKPGIVGPGIMGGKAGSDSGQILVQNRLKPRSGSDKNTGQSDID